MFVMKYHSGNYLGVQLEKEKSVFFVCGISAGVEGGRIGLRPC